MPNYFTENPERYEQRSLYDPQQQQVRQQLMQMGMQGVKQGPPDIKGLLEASRRNYQEKTVPQFVSQFGGGLKGGSDFKALLSELGRNFDTEQAGIQYNAQSQNFDRYQNMLNQALKPSFREDFIPRDPSYAERLGVPLARGGLEYGLQSLIDKAMQSQGKNKKIGQFEGQSGEENQDENSWWDWFKKILPFLASTGVGAATGGVPGALAGAATGGAQLIAGSGKPKPSFGARDIYKAAGQIPQYMPNPATGRF